MRARLLAPVAVLALLAGPALAAPSSASPAPVPAAPAVSAGSADAAGAVSSLAFRRAKAAKRVHSPARRAAALRARLAPAPAPARIAPAPALIAPAPVGKFSFMHVHEGEPVRWNPCDAVPWTFNPRNAPAGGLQAVQAAVAEVSARTGLRLEYAGTSAAPLDRSYLAAQAWGAFKPLHIGWSTPAESDLLSGATATTVGWAQVKWTGSWDAQRRNRVQIASSVVVLNAARTAPASGPSSWYTFALHELGHAVGLGHVDSDTEIMRPSIPASLAAYGTGDRAGLERLGAKHGCLPDIR